LPKTLGCMHIQQNLRVPAVAPPSEAWGQGKVWVMGESQQNVECWGCLCVWGGVGVGLWGECGWVGACVRACLRPCVHACVRVCTHVSSEATPK